MGSSEPDSVAVNRELWTRSNADYTDRQALGKGIGATKSGLGSQELGPHEL